MISFVWGIKDEPKRNLLDGRPIGASLDSGQQRILLEQSSQQLIAEHCEFLELLPPWRVVDGTVDCPLLVLKRDRKQRGMPWPLGPEELLPALRDLPRTAFTNKIGIEEDAATGQQSIIWIAASADTNVRSDGGPTEMREAAEYFEGVTDDTNERASRLGSSLRGWQTSASYIWMEAIEEAVSGTAGCVVSGAVLTAATLLLFTGSPGLMFATLVGVFAVLICFIGYLVERGYELGVIEAIATTIFIGFACDYCVHVAQVHRSAAGSFRHTLEHAGPSLYGAALTTTASAAPLLACEIVLFKSMGEFICVCTAFSLFVALTLIAPIVHLTHISCNDSARRQDSGPRKLHRSASAIGSTATLPSMKDMTMTTSATATDGVYDEPSDVSLEDASTLQPDVPALRAHRGASAEEVAIAIDRTSTPGTPREEPPVPGPPALTLDPSDADMINRRRSRPFRF